jgi:hypothetical protein
MQWQRAQHQAKLSFGCFQQHRKIQLLKGRDLAVLNTYLDM